MSKIAKDSQPVSHHKHITFGGDIVSPMAEVEDADGKQGELVVFCRQSVRDGKVLVVAAQKVKSAQKLRIKSLRFAGVRVQVVSAPAPPNLFFKFCSSGFCVDAFYIALVCSLRPHGTKMAADCKFSVERMEQSVQVKKVGAEMPPLFNWEILLTTF